MLCRPAVLVDTVSQHGAVASVGNTEGVRGVSSGFSGGGSLLWYLRHGTMMSRGILVSRRCSGHKERACGGAEARVHAVHGEHAWHAAGTCWARSPWGSWYLRQLEEWSRRSRGYGVLPRHAACHCCCSLSQLQHEVMG